MLETQTPETVYRRDISVVIVNFVLTLIAPEQIKVIPVWLLDWSVWTGKVWRRRVDARSEECVSSKLAANSALTEWHAIDPVLDQLQTLVMNDAATYLRHSDVGSFRHHS